MTSVNEAVPAQLLHLDEAVPLLHGVVDEAVDDARDEDAVVSRIAAVYEVPVDDIRDAVLTFLQHLATCQLLARA